MAAETLVLRADGFLDVDVQGDPSGDVRKFEDVRFVMKGGEVYKAP